jgi:predicted nucleic acid-binding protein
MILTDSNVLVHLVDTRDPRSELAESATEKLRSRRETLCIAPQNVVEFWAVATRPEGKNGRGMSALRASEEVAKILSLFFF